MRALIVGIDGQDGYYLSRFLKEIGYEVFGIARKKSVDNNLYGNDNLNLYDCIYADLTDATSIINAIQKTNPDEIYNLGGQSDIPLSWTQPLLTTEVNAVGVIKLLEVIRLINPRIKFFQASSSEIFGLNDGTPCDELTPKNPRNPYGVAKLFAHNCVNAYREKYGMFACSGILFNHESVRRNPEFVTRKISRAVARIANGEDYVLELGNLDAVRDWGFAGDYVRAMWMILQQDTPDDYVIATGIHHTVRDFVTIAFNSIDNAIVWQNDENGEYAFSPKLSKIVVRVNPSLIRFPLMDKIVSNPQKLYRETKFENTITFEELVASMVKNDISFLKKKL